MAHKKGVGSTDNGRDSISKRLGVKLFGGQFARSGNIIVRQRGTRFHPGENVHMGKDFTIHASCDGKVLFTTKRSNRTYINIVPELAEVAETVAPTKKASPKKEAPKAAEPKKEAVKAEPAAKPAKEVKETADELSPEAKKEANSALLASIGEASEADKNDLKKIKGVGPKLEEVLNGIGIYTFEQVSKMTDKEYDLVDSLIDSFKGRGKRDDWAKQASELK